MLACHLLPLFLSRFGSRCARIFRLVLQKKHLEQKQVEDFAMIPAKEAKDMLYKMLSENFISLQVTIIANQQRWWMREIAEANILNLKQTLYPSLRQKKKKDWQRHTKHLQDNCGALSGLVKKRQSQEITPESLYLFFFSSLFLWFILSSSLKFITGQSINSICWVLTACRAMYSTLKGSKIEWILESGSQLCLSPSYTKQITYRPFSHLQNGDRWR